MSKKYNTAGTMFADALNNLIPETDTETTATEKKAEPVKKKPTEKKTAPKSKRLVPTEQTETKSRRLQLLIRPSTFEKLAAEQEAAGFRSVNDFINAILEDYLK